MEKKILIVDDEPDISEFLKRKLDRSGYLASVANNGCEGLKMVKEQKFDLILTDIMMPVMDGFTFYRELKGGEKPIDTPVIILTALGSSQDTFLGLGAADFLAKPFSFEMLLGKIGNILIPRNRTHYRKIISILKSDQSLVEDIFSQCSEYNIEDRITVDAIEDEWQVISRTVQHPPDILFLNAILQKISVKELLGALRAFSQIQRLPIIVYRNFSNEKRLSPEGGEKQLQFITDTCRENNSLYIGQLKKSSFILSLYEY